MHIIIAPDSFKESLSAREVCAAIARGIRRVRPEAVIDAIPMADGGEGTVEALVAATGGTFRRTTVTGPLGEPVDAQWGILGDGSNTAVLEMAAASGLALVPPDRRNPMHTTTYGMGELIRAALESGVTRIIIGIGGSATTDGGTGAAQALGVTFLNHAGQIIPPPMTGEKLADIAHIRPTDILRGAGAPGRADNAGGTDNLGGADSPGGADNPGGAGILPAFSALDKGGHESPSGTGDSPVEQKECGTGVSPVEQEECGTGVPPVERASRPLRRAGCPPPGALPETLPGAPPTIAPAPPSTPTDRPSIPTLLVACDVDNPLCGPRGAAAVYGPQKGATPEQVQILDRNLAHLADIIERDLGKNVRDFPGAGAAGGLGAGLVAFFNAQLEPGIRLVMDAVHFTERIKGADLIITGEGRLDRQSMMGKVIAGVGQAGKAADVPVVALVGSLGEGAEVTLEILHSYHPIHPPGTPLPEALARTAEALESTIAALLPSLL